MIKLIYNPKNMLRMCEYAGRTCWQSHEHQKTPSEIFIGNIVKAGHESVIEHAHIILKAPKKEYSAATVLRALMNIEENRNSTTVNATMAEGEDNWYIGLNVRGLKNIVRNTSKPNVIRRDIINEIIPQLPSPFFADFIRDGVISDYTNLRGLELPYPQVNSKDRYSILTDLVELEESIKQLLDAEPELSVDKLSKMMPMTTRWVMPLPIAEQLLRHRSPVSKQSLRYCSGKNLRYHVPKELKNAKFKVARYLLDSNCPQSCKDILEFNIHDWVNAANTIYEQSNIIYKAKKEDCRMLLPIAVETETVTTKTMNQWGHVLDTRIDPHTQLHNRNLMSLIYLTIHDGYKILTEMIGPDIFERVNFDELYNINDI